MDGYRDCQYMCFQFSKPTHINFKSRYACCISQLLSVTALCFEYSVFPQADDTANCLEGCKDP